MGRAWACLIVLVGAGCASIQGASELDDAVDPGGETPGEDAGGPSDIGDGSGDGDARDGEDGAADGSSSPDDGSTGDGNPADGTPGDDAGTPPEPEADASVPPPVDGSCAAPTRLAMPPAGGVVSVSGDTSTATDSQAAPCAGLFSAPGPDQFYAMTMPFAGELEVVATPSGFLSTYQPSVYVLGTCDDARSSLGCNYQGSIAFGELGQVAAGKQLFIYVDSGATSLGGVTTPAQGAYKLEVAVRKVAVEGESCGTGRTDPHCTSGLGCRNESGASVCRAPRCGDGVVEGSEQCDDSNAMAGDGCSASCAWEGDTCDVAGRLVFVSEGQSRVARVSSTTRGLANDRTPACASQTNADRHFTFTLEAAATVTIDVTPTQSSYDPVVALYSGACSGLTQVRCADVNAGGEGENFSESGLAAGTYTLVVDGYTNAGDFDLTVTIGS